jgi:hypothetical protein
MTDGKPELALKIQIREILPDLETHVLTELIKAGIIISREDFDRAFLRDSEFHQIFTKLNSLKRHSPPAGKNAQINLYLGSLLSFYSIIISYLCRLHYKHTLDRIK